MVDTRQQFLNRLQAHYQSPYHRGPCPGCTHRYELVSPLCEDRIRIELLIDQQTIQDAWFEGAGCVVSQAAASILMQTLPGRSVAETLHFSSGEMLQLLGGHLSIQRQKCGLLAWRTLQRALTDC